MKYPYHILYNNIKLVQTNSLTQKPTTTESLKMTGNPCLRGKSSIKISKILIVLTGKYPENSIAGYLIDVSANLILNIGPEPINTIFHQNWIHKSQL